MEVVAKREPAVPLEGDLREVLQALSAFRRGDLGASLPTHWEGLQGRIAAEFNELVAQTARHSQRLHALEAALALGAAPRRLPEERLTGVWLAQAGTVNLLIDRLGHGADCMRQTADALVQLRRGQAQAKLPQDWSGVFAKVAEAFNDTVEENLRLSRELARLSRVVGKEGRLKERAPLPPGGGFWRESVESVNALITDLVHPTAEVARVIGAVAQGDLTKAMALEVEGRALQGEFLRAATTINRMLQQLASFASEVTQVAREVGTDGKLGGQARVQGQAGTWKDLTDSVNLMASNLTLQVRNIAEVTKAVAAGDLSRKITVDVQGEILELKNTINTMVDQLRSFGSEVTRVAREVGTDGKLGGQAEVPGAAGTWKGLTDSVNQLAANLTTQVRAIAEVATAVTEGDLTRNITVAARGEVAALKDTINEMIRRLRDTTRLNTEQDWLKTNLAKFSRMLQGHKELEAVARLILSELAPVVGAQQAAFYVLRQGEGGPALRLIASYAAEGTAGGEREIALGQGLVGQCAVDRRKILLTADIPGQLRIESGLAQFQPRNLLVMPVVFEGELRGVVELASVERFSAAHQAFLDPLAESIAIVIHTIEANARTENLLAQSQSLARELQQANEALQEKARQLALSSKYKTEFLANMSHELRTPLNSLLILSDQLSHNAEGNLSARQVEFARTIHSSGKDLLTLIDDILGLAKVESGTVTLEPGELRLADLQLELERSFRHVAEARGLQFEVAPGQGLPEAIVTDAKRLRQILKNLLANAFKFTHQGRVELRMDPLPSQGIAFSVTDTGIGIAADKQQIIFEAFQQADGSTSRKYGGTGLGLAISRELARLLGGEIRLVSAPGRGSSFTLHLPARFAGARRAPSAAGLRAPRVPRRLAAPPAPEPAAAEAIPPPLTLPNEAGDDREHIAPGEPVLLVAEADLDLTRIVLEAARGQGFKCLAASGGAAALTLANQHAPRVAIVGARLRDMPGERLLQRLQRDPARRHIAVCQLCTDTQERERALAGGALAVLEAAPGSRELEDMLRRLRAASADAPRRLLVGLQDGHARRELLALLECEDIVPVLARGPQKLMAALAAGPFDAVVLDEAALAQDPAALREALSAPGRSSPPLLLLAAHAPADWPGEVSCAPDLPGLFDAALRRLRIPLLRLPRAGQALARELAAARAPLAGSRVLIVDDDMRNIFALATVLEEHGVDIVWADNGRDAIQRVEHDGQIDAVLMDIMMPEMDGMSTMKAIRRLPQGAQLPMIAVTAKAMPGDREKSIEAGAWDYLSKPVNTQDLLCVLRAWLPQ